MENIIIPSDLIEQDNSYAMVTYIILQIILRPGNGHMSITPEWVGNTFGYEIPLSKKKREKINSTFKYLIEQGYLYKKNRSYYVDTNLFYHYGAYMSCSRPVFDELCCAPKLLRHYLILKDCEGKDFSLEYYADREGVSPSTIRRYNRDLEALGLIKTNTATYDPASGKRIANDIYTVLN